MKLIFLIIFNIIFLFGPLNGSKILGIFPSPSKSHYFVGISLMKGLAEKGHEVTVLAPFKEKHPIKNLKTIHLKEISDYYEGIKKHILNLRNAGLLETYSFFLNQNVEVTRLTLENENVQNLLNSTETFDLVICEIIMDEALLGFGQRFKAPIIATSAFGSNKWTNDMVGSPSPLSYVPNIQLGFSSKMTFLQRALNVAITIFNRIFFNFVYFHKQVSIYDHFFKDPKPDLEDICKNVSLVLLNTHFSLASPIPYVPNMIEVGGIHIDTRTKDLPLELKNFIESAEHGVIYFSLGSNVESKTLPVEKRDVLLNAFRSMKQKILWKWEETNLPGKPDNVMIRPWFPQNYILAHPNVKAFITHGGLLSITESIYFGIPIVGIPIFADQFINMAKAVAGEYGIIADYNLLSENYLKDIINEIMTNDKYSKNIKARSRSFRDQPLTPLETAIFWVEYVIRHGGAPHLRNAGMDLNFIQYHNIDVFAVFGAVFIFSTFIFYKFVRKIVNILGVVYIKSNQLKTTSKTKKIN